MISTGRTEVLGLSTGKLVGILLITACISALITYSNISFPNVTFLVLGFIALAVVMFYLLVWDLAGFLTLFVFLIPMSVPFSQGGSVLSMPSELLLIFTSGLFILKNFLSRPVDKKILQHPVSIVLLISFLWSVICALMSTMPSVSLKRVFMQFLFLTVFYFLLAEMFRKTDRIRTFFIAYGAGLIVPILWTLKEHSLQGFSMTSAFDVNKPFFPEHTIYAACLTFALLFIVVVRKGFEMKLLLIPLMILIALGIFYSFSRASWISIAAAAVVVVNYTLRPPNWVKILVAGIALTTVIYKSDQILDQFEYNRDVGYKGDLVEHMQSLTNISNDASNAERINRWFCAIDMFVDKPLFGFGPGTYQFKYGNYQRTERMTRISTFQGDGGNAHSEYLNILSEQGIPGMLLLLTIIIAGFLTLRRVILCTHSKFNKSVALALMAAFVSYFTHGLVNSFIDVDKAAVLIYGALAAAVALDLNFSSNPENHQDSVIQL